MKTASAATIKFMSRISQIKLSTQNRAQILDICQGYDAFHINSPERNLPLDLYLRFHMLKHKKTLDKVPTTRLLS